MDGVDWGGTIWQHFFFPTDYIGNKEYVFSSSGFPSPAVFSEQRHCDHHGQPLAIFHHGSVKVFMYTKMVGIQGRLPFATGAIFAEDLPAYKWAWVKIELGSQSLPPENDQS